jgi:E3 ubiquitin-protein ligase UBR7
LAEKDEFNTENAYNQNFMGMYCSCHRPYPDPESESEIADDSMIQCIICEDWLHSQHCLKYLNTDIEAMDEDHELICGPCMSRLDFLGYYSELALKPKPVDVESPIVNVEVVEEGKDAKVAEKCENTAKDCDEKIKENGEETSQDSGVDISQGADISSSPQMCPLLTKVKEALPFSDVNAVIWKDSFRSMLCRCASCLAMYKSLNIEYLLDSEDTIGHYEDLGKKNAEVLKLSAETSINDQMNQLGRVGQLEFIHGYNQFKEQLADFLKGHAEKGTVVQREDVNNFFAKVNEEQIAKRRRLE